MNKLNTTGYSSINQKDLIYIFKPYSSGTNPITKYSSDGINLAEIFQPYTEGNIKARAIENYLYNDVDLNTIFENLVTNNITDYNPFSSSTTVTSYTYNIFNVSGTFTLEQSVSNAHILVIGGGGGINMLQNNEQNTSQTSNQPRYEGSGGNSITLGPVSLNAGTYTISIGYGSKTGTSGESTSITGPEDFNTLIATGGESGSENSNSSNTQYTFQDGTNTTFNFGEKGSLDNINFAFNDIIYNIGSGGNIESSCGNDGAVIIYYPTSQ
jgi:hypothetical protein